MRDFVDDRTANLFADRCRTAEAFNQRPVEKNDAVGKRHAEIVAALRERRAFVEAEERILQRIEPRALHLLRGRFLFDEHRDVFHPHPDLAR